MTEIVVYTLYFSFSTFLLKSIDAAIWGGFLLDRFSETVFGYDIF